MKLALLGVFVCLFGFLVYGGRLFFTMSLLFLVLFVLEPILVKKGKFPPQQPGGTGFLGLLGQTIVLSFLLVVGYSYYEPTSEIASVVGNLIPQVDVSRFLSGVFSHPQAHAWELSLVAFVCFLILRFLWKRRARQDWWAMQGQFLENARRQEEEQHQRSFEWLKKEREELAAREKAKPKVKNTIGM